MNCGGNSPPQFGQFNRNEERSTVEVVEVQESTISKQVRSFGSVQAKDVVEITPQVSNRITKIHADLGDTVRQGDLLAEIYAVPFRDRYQQAKAQLRQSKTALRRDSLQYERQKKLYQRELISATEFENAKANYESSLATYQSNKANLTQSHEDLKNTNVRSPVFGVVLNRNISEGDLANTGQTVFEIANLTGYEIRVHLPLEDWEAVDIGQEVKLRVSNQSGASATGRVSRISPRLDPTTGLGEVVITLTSAGPSIHQGVLCETIINVEKRENTVVIPRNALVEKVETLIEPESNTIQLDRSYAAFTVQGDSLAQYKPLKLGLEQGDKVEVLSGLQAGDKLVITGQSGLDDSAKVRIADQPQFQQQEGIPIERAEDDTTQATSTPDNSN